MLTFGLLIGEKKREKLEFVCMYSTYKHSDLHQFIDIFFRWYGPRDKTDYIFKGPKNTLRKRKSPVRYIATGSGVSKKKANFRRIRWKEVRGFPSQWIAIWISQRKNQYYYWGV